jgi:hypothetical protein
MEAFSSIHWQALHHPRASKLMRGLVDMLRQLRHQVGWMVIGC